MDDAAFDPRVTPARYDLAAKHLEGKVQAARFTEGDLREVVVPQAPLRSEPLPNAPLSTEALKGERVTVYESTAEGWSWVQLRDDGYVGWMPSETLHVPGPPPTHKVSVLRTLVFPGPSIKLPPVEALPLGCKIAVVRVAQPFAVTATNGFVPFRHLMDINLMESDPAAVAERFIGTPYLWGGKTSFGLDCSALVQIAFNACGQTCPRDSDMQEQLLGGPVEAQSGASNLLRGDLVFWKGHVALARDSSTLIHANAFHMAVAIEPITEAIARIAATGSPVTSIGRRRRAVQ
jgi:Bacterial dipeptidyl-peptidase Sh3 domain/NlpC/P60 family